MKRIDALLADYASYHRARGNVVCHFAGITLIVFGILSMLSAIRLGADLVIPVARLGSMWFEKPAPSPERTP